MGLEGKSGRKLIPAISFFFLHPLRSRSMREFQEPKVSQEVPKGTIRLFKSRSKAFQRPFKGLYAVSQRLFSDSLMHLERWGALPPEPALAFATLARMPSVTHKEGREDH